MEGRRRLRATTLSWMTRGGPTSSTDLAETGLDVRLYSTNGSDWQAHRTKHLDGKQVEDHRMAIGPEGQAFVYATVHH